MTKTIEELTDELDKAFEGEFMQPNIELDDWIAYETGTGESTVEQAMFFKPDEMGIRDGETREVLVYKGYYGARMSASGYLDCTDWNLFQHEADAIQFLLDTYAQ